MQKPREHEIDPEAAEEMEIDAMKERLGRDLTPDEMERAAEMGIAKAEERA